MACFAPLAIGACGEARGNRSSPAAEHDSGPRQATLTAADQRGRVRVLGIGHSATGGEILVRIVGPSSASRRILVVGCVHGDERAGEGITRHLRTITPPQRTALWLVDEFNPDGCRANTRQNARGVDLNRNSPWHWQPLEHPGGTFYSGSAPLSEPESRAIRALVMRLRPAISVWYPQHASLGEPS